jgi:hypothetical protein
MILQEIADSSSLLRWIEVDNPSKAEIAARTKVFLHELNLKDRLSKS